MLAHGTTNREAWLWHRRLGHPSLSYLHILFPKLFPLNKPLKCETCILAKSHRHSYKLNNTKVGLPFSLVHSYVWGPAEVVGGQKFRFFVLFIDDCTHMTWIYFLKHKSEVFDKFTMFYKLIQTQYKTIIQILRSDNGGEFINKSMEQFCQEKGIIHQTTCSHTPEQNGVVERKNRILLEITRAMLIEAKVPKFFWPEALATATYLINRLPTKALNLKTPLQSLSEFTKIPPPLTLKPRIFGCSVFVHIPKINRHKLGPCAEKCVFVGYGINKKGYRCYNPQKRHMYTTMDCHFLETDFFYPTQHSGQGEKEYNDTLSWLSYNPISEEISHDTQDIEPTISATSQDTPGPIPEVNESETHNDIQNNNISNNHETGATEQTVHEAFEEDIENEEHDEDIEDNQDETIEGYVLPPRSNLGVPPKRYSPERYSRSSRYPLANIAEGNLSQEAKAFASSLYNDQIPNSINQALESENWKKAMEIEMEALMRNDTWEKCVVPPGKKTVGCRWVFTIKRKPENN
ncbi:putative RNA-directed DNA polymerase [Helianthus annuus]|nr:putative RNA-directed DNA polymerase [Helianthus annuus]